jgi:peptide/nickel transport system permease protein
MSESLLAISAPTFWLGLMTLFLFSKDIGTFHIFDGAGTYVGLTANPGRWFGSLVLPRLVLAASLAVTALGIDIGFLLGGAVVVESVFNVPGVGYLAYQGIHNADLPIIEGTVQFGAFSIVIANLIVDIAHAFPDPRVRYS